MGVGPSKDQGAGVVSEEVFGGCGASVDPSTTRLDVHDASDIPVNFSELKQLKILRVNCSNLTHIPDGISPLSNLEMLDLGNNHLVSVTTGLLSD